MVQVRRDKQGAVVGHRQNQISWKGLFFFVVLLSLLGFSLQNLLLFGGVSRSEVLLESDQLQHISCPTTNQTTTSRKSTAAIASLVSNSEQDVRELCRALKSLRLLPDYADPSLCRPLAPVLIFHEDGENGLSQQQQLHLHTCLEKRDVFFPKVQFDEFPAGFDPIKEEANHQRRSKWGYHQMIRFWITKIWEHPSIKPYETIMRLDSDACYRRRILRENTLGTSTQPHHWNVPGLPPPPRKDSPPIVYHAGEFMRDNAQVTQHFAPFVHRYVREHNLTIHNPALFEKIPAETKGINAAVPMFYNNFEVSRVSFMLRSDVKAFHYAMTEQEPFGVFRHRWGDAIERYATMSIFVSEEEIIRRAPIGYQHRCGGDSVLGDKSGWFWW